MAHGRDIPRRDLMVELTPLATLRVRARLTQTAAANLAGIPIKTWRRLERAEIRPNLDYYVNAWMVIRSRLPDVRFSDLFAFDEQELQWTHFPDGLPGPPPADPVDPAF